MSERIDYVELPAGDLAAAKSFYTAAFGWGFTDYGPTYAGFEGAGLDGGLASGDAASKMVPLVILKADDLEAALAARRGRRGHDHRTDLRVPRRPAIPLPRPGGQ